MNETDEFIRIFAHPWLFLLLPLPHLVRALLPAYREEKESVRAPFFDEIASASGSRPTLGCRRARRRGVTVPNVQIGCDVGWSP